MHRARASRASPRNRPRDRSHRRRHRRSRASSSAVAVRFYPLSRTGRASVAAARERGERTRRRTERTSWRSRACPPRPRRRRPRRRARPSRSRPGRALFTREEGTRGRSGSAPLQRGRIRAGRLGMRAANAARNSLPLMRTKMAFGCVCVYRLG